MRSSQARGDRRPFLVVAAAFVLLVLLLVLGACSSLDEFAETRLPVTDARLIAEAAARAIDAGDLDKDGGVQGFGEWVEFARSMVKEVQALLAAR